MNQEEKRTIPVCFTRDQLKILESYSKENGLLNYSQAIEKIAADN